MADIVENNPATILSDIVTKYESAVGRTTYTADPDRLMLNVLAYRESLVRALLNRVSDANYPQTATGDRLDYWGQIIGVSRNTDESDDAYRVRILAKSDSSTSPIGSRSRYQSLVKAMSGVSDVLVRNLRDGEDLAVGEVKFVLIEKKTDDRGFVYGTSSTEELHSAIISALERSAETLEGDYFVCESATPAHIAGTIHVRKKITAGNITDAVTNAIDTYLASLSVSYNSTYDEPTLQRAIEAVDGVYGVVSISLSVPVLDVKDFYSKGNVTLTID